MTLAELAITDGLLAALGLVASRVGLSAILASVLAGLLLGPNEPKVLSLVRQSEVNALRRSLASSLCRNRRWGDYAAAGRARSW
jgi:Kef-type K+ transport system membrane component KefB